MIRMTRIFAVDRAGGPAKEQPYGPARYISFGQRGVVIGRHGRDPALWKRYRGGTIGQLWVDRNGRGRFQRLIETGGNPSSPAWIRNRIYFHSDHEGIGNLYSCTPEGWGLQRHTNHKDYYLRNLSTDGRRVVYHAGADLFLFDPRNGRSRKINIDFRSPRTQRNRKYVNAARYLEDYAPHPKGHSVALTVRGRVFAMANWEGSVHQHGSRDGVRYRLAHWLADGKRLVAVTDEGGEETLVIFHADGSKKPVRLPRLDTGRPLELEVSPKKDQVALANHRHELVLVDLAKKKRRVLDRSPHGRIAGLAWSPDGRWLAYGFQETPHLGVLRLCQVAGGKKRSITRAVLRDVAPAFDPEGKYLYFLSYREFDPVYDNMHFELGFPRGMRPALVTLRKDLRSPFVPEVREAPAVEKKKSKKKAPALKVDLDDIEDRVVAFPVPEGRYGQIAGIKGGAVFTSFPVEGALGQNWLPGAAAAKGTLEVYKFEDQKKEVLVRGISDFERSGEALFYRVGSKLRAIKAGEKADETAESEAPSKKSGWIDLHRLRVSVDPGAEWRQMFQEAWRLMRDHFWTEDMSGVNWKKVGDRYRPLVDRVATRSEFSDLIWETQGELSTSHCYEMGGDYRPEPRYDVGLLAAEFEFDAKRKGYRIAHIVKGDVWDERNGSPLGAPGVNLRKGDVVVAVNGRSVDRRVSPQELLVHQAGMEVTLTLAGGRSVNVRTLRSEYPARYREMISRNRDRVRRASRGRIGYVHIPDMGPTGFSEFHRQFLAEVDREALLIDVRYNGGGHVSQLLLEKLLRKRVGYDLPRWGQPDPYPGDSPRGPMLALTNEQAGSDGDIFSHCWKLFGLGPLVGRRTWGGVVGIWPRHQLVDGSVTTQPEFSFWFKDVGFGVENHGTEPDVDVDIAPHEHAAGKDPQLDLGIKMLLDELKRNPPRIPSFRPRPKLSLPKFPKR